MGIISSSAETKSIFLYRNAKIVAGFFVLIHLMLVFLFKDNLPLRSELSDLFLPVVSCFGAGGLIYALLNADRQEKKVRFALILMASAMISNSMAETAWVILEIGLHQQPFPSLADGFFIMFYPLFAMGLIFLPAREFTARERNRIIIDIIIIMAAAVLISWDFLIGPILAAGEESEFALALSAAYPILDLVLLFALLELLYRRQNSLDTGPMLHLVAAVTFFIVSDIYFSIQTSDTTYASGGLIDTGYVLSYSLIGLAGILQANKWRLPPEGISKEFIYEPSTWIQYLPYAGVSSAYMLLIWNESHPLPIDLSVATATVGGIIALVLVRQIIALNENASLYLETKKEIDDRKTAEEALKESKRRLTDIISFLPDATFVIDREGRVIAWNRAMEILTGSKAEDMIGKDDYEYALPFYRTRRPILIDLALRPDINAEKNYDILQKEGEDIIIGEVYIPSFKPGGSYLWGKATPLFDSERHIVGAIESIRDITDRKRAEEALHKAHSELELRVNERTAELKARNAEMEQFVYTVSHDLRSPLISVGGVMGFLKKDLEKGDAKRIESDFRLIEDAVARMDRLLGETLELSRIGRVVNPPENVPFREIVNEALEQTAEKRKLRGIGISIAESLPVVHVDRMRFVEALVNLIENSVKYMDNQSKPCIEIGHRMDKHETVFFVKDNGMGIDPSQHDKVFELFYKANKKSEGTGAGLAIVKRIIEVHGGRIWIESELGKGCTTCFTLQ